MIQGRSALTNICRSMLTMIDAEVSVEEAKVKTTLRVDKDCFRQNMALLEERGFIVRRAGIAISLSTSPGYEA